MVLNSKYKKGINTSWYNCQQFEKYISFCLLYISLVCISFAKHNSIEKRSHLPSTPREFAAVKQFIWLQQEPKHNNLWGSKYNVWGNTLSLWNSILILFKDW